jgi:hypothetical protein
MESIGTVIEEVMDFLSSKKLEDKIHGELLHKILLTAFYASLQREELASLKFDFVYLNPVDPDPEPPFRIRVSRWKIVRLAHSVEFTDKSIAKLGLATDRRTSALAVYADETGVPYIWGFIDQGTNTHLFDTHESTGGWPYPGILHVSVRDVGYLVITHQSEKIIEIKQDGIIYPPLNVFTEGNLSRALDKVVDRLLERSQKYIDEFGFIDDEEPDSPYAYKDLLRRDFQHTLSRIILRIQSYGHGGAFVITPEAESSTLNIKYRLNYDRLAESLARRGVLRLLNEQYDNLVMNQFENGRKTLDGELYFKSVITQGELEDSEEELTGSIWFASLLSRVDGLIVFDETFSIQGFGAEILVDDASMDVLNATTIAEEFLIKTSVPVDPLKFGTRHRSMMRYINKNPNAIGFVISQDGAEKVMINVDGKVVYWDNIKLTVH